MDFLINVYIFISSLLLTVLPAREIREGVILQPISFYPMKAENQVEKTISKLLFRGLFKYNIYGELENDLAESYNISSDGLEYTFKLKDNQFWTSGQNSSTAVAGTTNTGGGGGAKNTAGSGNASGGSGIVILSIPTSKYSGTTTGSPTVTTSGSNTILQFTASGSYTA